MEFQAQKDKGGVQQQLQAISRHWKETEFVIFSLKHL